MDYKNLATRNLIDKCVSRDPLAWAEFIGRFSRLIEFSVKKTLEKYPDVGAGESVKDIRQDIFMSLWNKNKLAKVVNRRAIKYWLVVMSRNAAVDHLRRQEKNVLAGDESYFEKFPARIPVGEEAMQNTRDLSKKIKRACNSLASKEKIIFKLYFKKRLKAKEIAEILNISLGGVTSTVAKIRKKINSEI